jgi:CheY-like chemotaxis protein
MDGLEATKRIRDAGSNVPIIALTANAMPGDQEKCLDAGCTGYLAKPVDYEALVAELQKYLRPVNPAGVNAEQQTNQPQEGEVLCPNIQ